MRSKYDSLANKTKNTKTSTTDGDYTLSNNDQEYQDQPKADDGAHAMDQPE
jgi:hypothetical protein